MNTRIVLTLLLVTGLAAGGVATAADTAPAARSDGVAAVISDTAITASIRAKFLGKDVLKGSDINVDTTNGAVTLKGTAPSADARLAAADFAKSVDGVKSVDNELVVAGHDTKVDKAVAETERVGSDTWITTKVKSAILADSVSKGFEVSVKTVNGVVILSGTLANTDAITHVKDLAMQVKSVKSVDTAQLKAKP
jgi:hyperosmotically inducible protein